MSEIAEEAFRDCSKLQRLVMADTVKALKNQAFYCSSSRKITISKNLETIVGKTFSGMEVTEITIPSKVREIPEYCFNDCNRLKKVTIERGVRLLFLPCQNKESKPHHLCKGRLL